ncbi:hypothetical protein F4604DRAFT_1827138 [Suillus subluteus]|nr:hypothetical protein F4604DRAFT_1827138 [Suillus subluteus]
MFWYGFRPRRMRGLSHRVVMVIFICATVIWLWSASTPVSKPKSAAWTVAAEILDTLDTGVDDYVRSAMNPSVQVGESFSTRLLEQRDAATQELLQCFSDLSQCGSCSLSSASPVLPSIMPLSDDTQIHVSGSPIKPISCLCSSLAGKRLTIVGGDHVYRFHNLLLDHQKRSEGKRFPCLGKEFCTHHHLCLRATRNNPLLKEEPMRYISSPSVEELVQTGSSLDNYYSVPYIHAFSGVRSRETYWLTSAKKADVLILGRGPFSAPPSTYTGNWSLLLDFPSHVGSYHAKIPSFAASIPNPLQIVDAAIHATLGQTLGALRVNGCFNRKKKVIWLVNQPRFPGNGRGQKIPLLCTYFLPNGQDEPSPGDLKAVLLHLVALSTNERLDDPWTLYYNVQVYLQDRLLRQVLPRFGVHLLQFESFVEAGPNVAGPQLQYRRSHT